MIIKVKNLKSKFKKGFTIVELIVFMGLFSILIVVLTQILSSALSLQLESESKSNVEQDGRYILERMMYDINRTQGYNINSAGTVTPPVITPAIVTPAANGASATSLKLNVGGNSYLYSLDGSNNLTLSVNGGTADMLNGFDTSITNLTFTRINGPLPPVPTPTPINTFDTVQIQFTVTGRTVPASGPKIKVYTTTVGLR